MTGGSNGCEKKPSRAAQSLSADKLVGRKVRQRRTTLGIANDDLAHAIGVTPAQLEAFESGKARVDPPLLAEIARVLGVSVTWFFVRTDDPD